jgi:hypothetical protein
MGNFIEDMAGGGYPRITCQSCERAIVKQPCITYKGWESDKFKFKSHHDNCNGLLMRKIARMLFDRGVTAADVKTAGYIHHAITTGEYNDMLGEQNKNSREIFTELTGIKFPKKIKDVGALFTGKPFTVKE